MSISTGLLLESGTSTQKLKNYEHQHFSDPVVENSHRHVENVILLGKTNTAIHGQHINVRVALWP